MSVLLSWRDVLVAVAAIVILVVNVHVAWSKGTSGRRPSVRVVTAIGLLVGLLSAAALSIVLWGLCWKTQTYETVLRSLETHALASVALVVFFLSPCRAKGWALLPLLLITLLPLVLHWCALFPFRNLVAVDDFSWRPGAAIALDGFVFLCLRLLARIITVLLVVAVLVAVFTSRYIDVVAIVSLVVLAGTMTWRVGEFGRLSWDA